MTDSTETRPETFTQSPGETDVKAGQRLFREALVASGSPHYIDSETGLVYPLKAIVPGKGQVLSDGTLGPLPVQA